LKKERTVATANFDRREPKAACRRPISKLWKSWILLKLRVFEKRIGI